MATMTLDEFTNQLRAAFGDTLKAAVLYGSAATAEKPTKQADYNVLVLLDRFDPRRIAGAAAMSRAWTEAGNPAPRGWYRWMLPQDFNHVSPAMSSATAVFRTHRWTIR